MIMERLSLDKMAVSQEKYNLYNISNPRIPPVMVELLINKKRVVMVVDTKASCSVISPKIQRAWSVPRFREKLSKTDDLH